MSAVVCSSGASSTENQCTEKDNHSRLMALFHTGTDVKRSLLQHYITQKNLSLEGYLHERYHYLPKDDVKCAIKAKNVQLSDLSIYAIDILLTDHCFDLYWDCCINKESLENILNNHKEDLYHLYQNIDHDGNDFLRNSKERNYLRKDQWELLYKDANDSQLSTHIANEGITLQSFDSNMNFVVLSTVCPLYKSIQVVTANQMKISQIAVEQAINNDVFNDIWEQMDTNLKPISIMCVFGNYYEKKLDSIKKTTFKRAQTRENQKYILESTFNNPVFCKDAVFLHRVQKELNHIEFEETKDLVTKLFDKEIPVRLVHGQYQAGSYLSAIVESTRKYLPVCQAEASRKDSNLKSISSSSNIDEEQRSIDRQRYLKFVCLIQDVAKIVLVGVLKNRLPGADFGNALNGMKKRLRPLLNDHQIQLIYPEGSKYNGDLSDMDVSLLYIILRNLNTICPHQNGWGKDPEENDRSVSANIDRIRNAKNTIVSHSSNCSLGEAEFHKNWETLRQCCVELGGEYYEETIDTLLTSTFSCDLEQQISDSLEKIKENDAQNEKNCKKIEDVLDSYKEWLENFKKEQTVKGGDTSTKYEEDSIPLTLRIQGTNLQCNYKMKEHIQDYNNKDMRVIAVEDGSIIIRLQMFSSAFKSFGYFLAVIDKLLQKTMSNRFGSKDGRGNSISISLELSQHSEVKKEHSQNLIAIHAQRRNTNEETVCTHEAQEILMIHMSVTCIWQNELLKSVILDMSKIDISRHMIELCMYNCNSQTHQSVLSERKTGHYAFSTKNTTCNQITDKRHLEGSKYPLFQSQNAKNRSFDNWRFEKKQTAKNLSEAGYFYTGEHDIVRCFNCDLGLAEWDPADDPWTEHARHNPKCWFLRSKKGEQFIEIIQQDWKKIYNPKHAAFDDKGLRKATFKGWSIDIEQTPDILADAGFFFTGEEDVVRCHYCDGGLRNWEPKDVPWEEHARWFPFCKFVIKMKGREYIDEIKAKHETAIQEPNTETSLRNGAIVKSILDMGFEMKDIIYAVNEYTKDKGNSHYNAEDLLNVLMERHEAEKLKQQFEALSIDENQKDEGDPEKVREVNKELKKNMMCIRCEKSTKSILFVECGHRVTCETCASDLDFCPYCDVKIKTRLKTFLS